jgi:signal transduction histidine kinase
MNDELSALQSQVERLSVLHQVSNVIHSSLDPREALGLVLREAVRLVRATSGSVVLFNPTTGLLEIEAAHGLPDSAAGLQLRVGSGVPGWVARTGQPLRIGDVSRDTRYLSVDPRTRSELAVPLPEVGQVRGVLNVESDRADAFTSADQSLLEELAGQTARVIHNTWLHEQFRLKARLFEGLFNVGQAINSTLNLDEALATITREAATLMAARVCTLHLLDDSRQWLDLRASHGAGRAYLRKPRLSADESLLGVVLRRMKPQQVEDVRVSARYQHADVARKEGLVSLLSVPLRFSGEATGALSVYKPRLHTFSNEEVRILSALADLSAIAIEKARLYERIVDVEEQLRQNEKLSALGLLAAEVAHEIRNPLTVMKLLYHSLDLRFADADPRAQDARIMGEKMEHLNRIVEQVLDFARSTEPQLAPVDLNQLIEDLGLLTRHKLAHLGIVLERKLDPALPAISADATQLEQAFLNLTLNAVEAMPSGGRLTLTTRVARAPRSHEPPTHIEVEFKDTGAGMSEEQRKRAFTSLLNTTKARGTGLGLAIVRRVVETHRGKVRIASRAGRGTAITVTLPLQ